MGEEEKTTSAQQSTGHEPPAGGSYQGAWEAPDGGSVAYEARAGWTVLHEKDEPAAEMFSVSYLARDTGADRPVTFVFNGGPGASSAYLHLGALGPERVRFHDDGTPLPPPSRLEGNPESWLAFTDLVFIDPIGTGFSRLVPAKDEEKKADGAEGKEKRFFGFKRDLESIGEFCRRWLSAHRRWDSPVFIAGESYGGYRVARLARLLPESYGIGLNGVVVISPALEFSLLAATDYDVLPWLDRLPTMAASAHAHGRGRALPADASLEDVLAAAEEFATGDYATFLTQGAAMAPQRREEVLTRMADLIGLSVEQVTRAEGRIEFVRFARDLLADEGRAVGIYDATVTAANPFPDRDGMSWPDPTLSGIERVFAAAANQQIRGRIGVQTDREYHLLSHEVNSSWREDDEARTGWVNRPQGATDDLRYALALSPQLRVFLTHGRYDLITPYYSSDRLANLMRLREDDGERFTVRHYPGGHMFYTWAQSRRDFRDAMADFFADAVGEA